MGAQRFRGHFINDPVRDAISSASTPNGSRANYNHPSCAATTRLAIDDLNCSRACNDRTVHIDDIFL